MTTPSYRRVSSVVLASIAVVSVASAAFALEGFSKPADEYPAKQSQGHVTVAVEAVDDPAVSKEIFGKAEPTEHGILPVLVVISNKGTHPIKLENLAVRYVPAPGAEGIEALRGEDLATFNPKGYQPKQRKIPGIGVGKPKVKKGPLARSEVADREWAAPLVPPGVQETGFFFFNVLNGSEDLSRASIYITGLYDMKAGQELFYFEIPLKP